jgi:hypothetical protein
MPQVSWATQRTLQPDPIELGHLAENDFIAAARSTEMSLILLWFQSQRLSNFLEELEPVILAELNSGNQQWEQFFQKNCQGRNQKRKSS